MKIGGLFKELFSFLLDFAKLGDAEAEFLLSIQARY
jgi:hypothetical protein